MKIIKEAGTNVVVWSGNDNIEIRNGVYAIQNAASLGLKESDHTLITLPEGVELPHPWSVFMYRYTTDWEPIDQQMVDDYIAGLEYEASKAQQPQVSGIETV